jgi:hypothetical protein
MQVYTWSEFHEEHSFLDLGFIIPIYKKNSWTANPTSPANHIRPETSGNLHHTDMLENDK